jgi:hypothetical protein
MGYGKDREVLLMCSRIKSKMKDDHGLTILTWITLVAVVALSITAALPALKEYRRRVNATICEQGMDTCRREITTEFISNFNQQGTPEEAKALITKVMLGWDDLCPDLGTCHIIPKSQGMPYDIICGLHNPDTKQNTRLNADYVLEQLKTNLAAAQKSGTQYPESLTYTLHGKERTAYLIDQQSGLKWGTDLNSSYDGIVAFYSVVGHSSFGADSGAEDGTLWYFSYADEKHCANWNINENWTGDSYRGLSS